MCHIRGWALSGTSGDGPLAGHTCSCLSSAITWIHFKSEQTTGIRFIYVLSILFWRGCTPTSSRSLTVNTEHPPHLCAKTSCLAMKSLILCSVRLTCARKKKEKKAGSGLDLEYCNTRALALLFACLCGQNQAAAL